jgi:hypothetical protein
LPEVIPVTAHPVVVVSFAVAPWALGLWYAFPSDNIAIQLEAKLSLDLAASREQGDDLLLVWAAGAHVGTVDHESRIKIILVNLARCEAAAQPGSVDCHSTLKQTSTLLPITPNPRPRCRGGELCRFHEDSLSLGLRAHVPPERQ